MTSSDEPAVTGEEVAEQINDLLDQVQDHIDEHLTPLLERYEEDVDRVEPPTALEPPAPLADWE